MHSPRTPRFDHHPLVRFGIIIPVLLILGCHKQISVDLKTPAQRVAVYNGILAEADRAVVAGVITLENSKVLTAQQTRAVLEYAGRIANASSAVAVLQQNPGDWAVTAAQIKTIMDQISPPSDILKWLGATGAQGQAVLTAVTGIQSAIQSIIMEVSR